ncbi:unnamed protein product, partial [Dicrocoelium dendriticum]
QQQKQFEQSNLRLYQILVQSLSLQPKVALTTSNSEFHFEPTFALVFDSWYKRWKETFEHEFIDKSGSWKSLLLIQKSGTVEHDRFVNFILLKQLKDLDFVHTVEQLREIFSNQLSIFNFRYNCLKFAKRDADDYVTYCEP